MLSSFLSIILLHASKVLEKRAFILRLQQLDDFRCKEKRVLLHEETYKLPYKHWDYYSLLYYDEVIWTRQKYTLKVNTFLMTDDSLSLSCCRRMFFWKFEFYDKFEIFDWCQKERNWQRSRFYEEGKRIDQDFGPFEAVSLQKTKSSIKSTIF